ncbi:MAG TPA: PIG-L family deacetylase [Candidatus Acidoferrales bacterium]|nr:PIG-L family deacetylase [Candidatus Acidoferrales bacterium]
MHQRVLGMYARRSAALGLASVLLCPPGVFGSGPVPIGQQLPGAAVLRPHLETPPAPALPKLSLPNAATSRLLLSQEELHVPARLRLLVFAPHPDDETLGAGGLIQRVRASGGTVRIVFVTNGDGYVDGVRREVKRAGTSQADFLAYGERRHNEALRALGELGLASRDAVFLGFPDDGIDDLWAGHWSTRRPYTSPYTRFDRPPYKDSLNRRVAYAGVDLESEVIATLRDFQPDWVLMPDPRDRHPDHCTSGVFVLDALRKLRQEGTALFTRTQVLSYLVHYPDYPASAEWVKEIEGAGVGGSRTAGRALAATRWLHLPLAAVELAGKRRAVSAYDSQVQVMNPFLKQFLRSVELFGRLDAAQVTAVPREYAARFRHPK